MAKGKSEEDQPTSDAAGEEEDDEEEEEGDEYSAEHKAAMKAYKEEVQALHAEMEQAGRSLVRVGGTSVPSQQQIEPTDMHRPLHSAMHAAPGPI